MYVERNMQMSSDLATNQISLLNPHSNPVHRKYERFACTIRIGLKYLSTSKGKTHGKVAKLEKEFPSFKNGCLQVFHARKL